ncbi:hypothetical protein BC939DRAFT_207912 [Gamsiella multidivaricata]|uniref:uncharacterized protein n=1 Tax=Gamsiella multidivaricata TaxID=101098 RepID=UPI00221F423C|nr:uncharacterized protein BC939DRAFT_207912 [Gamsiella multidivaricata]KAI7821362.1 hypothetical protein BC939DRAFT_207912 [Gamsiella multidivaricata]
MSVKPDPARATSPPSASTLPATVSPIAQVHQQPQEHSALPLHRLESSSTSRTGTPTFASGYNLPHSSESGDFRASHSPFIPDVPVNDSNTYTGRPVLDSSRRYSSGYPSIALSSVQASPTSGGSTLANKRLSKFGGQALTLAPTPESPSAGQVANTNTSAIIHTPTSATIHTPTSAIPTAIRRSISGFHTFVPDFINSPHDPDHTRILYRAFIAQDSQNPRPLSTNILSLLKTLIAFFFWGLHSRQPSRHFVPIGFYVGLIRSGGTRYLAHKSFPR